MMPNEKDTIDAVIYMPATPIAITATNNPTEFVRPVTYRLLSGKKTTLPTLQSVIDSNLFQACTRAMFSVNQTQAGKYLVVSIHPASSVITISCDSEERRDD